MNRLAQFLQYTEKVFELKRLLRSVRDGRCQPEIPILPVALCLMLGVVTRISSYLDLGAANQESSALAAALRPQSPPER